MKKIFNLARTMAAALFLLAAIAAGVLIGTGKVRTERLAALLAPAPEEAQAEKPAEEAPLSEAEEIARKNLAINRELQDRRRDFPLEVSRYQSHLELLKKEYDERVAALTAEQAAFGAKKEEFEKFKKEYEEKIRDEGFKKNLEILQKMDPAQAAATIRNWSDEEILRYFLRMKSAAVMEIVAELNKFPARATEGQRGAELLNKLDEFVFNQGSVGN